MTPDGTSSSVFREVLPIGKRIAIEAVVSHHYLHRKPPISFAYGMYSGERLVGVVTFGVPASRHMVIGACPSMPSAVLELNRLWVADDQLRNTETWFLARALSELPARIILSYADTSHGHLGYVYRAANFYYAGWTGMERKTARYDYVVPGKHSRDAFRIGFTDRVRRKPKVKYWTVTGNRRERAALKRACLWPKMDWRKNPPPSVHAKIEDCT